ncbi:hypothetical protein JMJ77_0000889, partial [Colletotrichum scovillei]
KTRRLSSQKRQEGTRWDGRTVRFLTIHCVPSKKHWQSPILPVYL